MAEKCILIVDDEKSIREQVVNWLMPLKWTMLQAEHMAQARQFLRTRWGEIKLIIMDVMLPEDEAHAQEVKRLIEQREGAYDHWLALEDSRHSDNDPEWRKARFAVDALDQQIFDLLNVEGGIQLIQECLDKLKGERLHVPVLYLTARENQSTRDKGTSLIDDDKSDWLVKPVTQEEVRSAANRLINRDGKRVLAQ